MIVRDSEGLGLSQKGFLEACLQNLVGLRMQMQNAAFFERKGPERKPWPRGEPLKRKK